ncbi:cytochrome ubiquinol oxidase subunit I [Parvibium lacunae]|uniref:Cytochrome ubiquinol oxidase subunit I n=1 Tax=Parvibium lacunae TaxID=1888893 RepID=A0A368L6W2_9BURK|nr:cytochrome ubiquinol oxidase subunit I [Parvibium lacunae]RCS59428.1 cytochrome ubiquinol oxidase subunit I [Parvibium lacunae]
MDALLLARIQFAANISFHILFPTISIGLGWLLFYFKWQHLKTKLPHWQEAYLFWVKIFALTFALGVVSGITMSFQFGTNWPGFMKTVGNIAGPLLAYEVLTAFFLEATFLGIMLFGQQRVSARVHLLATFLVAFGTTISAFWILALNSWMHTPSGYVVREGVAHVLDWWQVIFNPSLPYRLTHMLLASGLTVAFLVAGISAWRKLRGDQSQAVHITLKTSLWLAACLIPIQILVGDLHGLNTLKYQPAKIAAIEAVWETERGAPLVLFAIPNSETRQNDFAISIPKLASLILTHDANGLIQGLDNFADAPPVKPLFYGFRIMVGVGVLMLLASWFGVWQLWRQGVNALSCRYMWLLVGMTFSGWVATLAGWYVTEIGRQPYLVYGLLRTAEAASTVSQGNIALSLVLYLTLYAVLIVAYIKAVFYLAKKAIPATSTPSEVPYDSQ